MENITKTINFERINLLYNNAPIAINGLIVGFIALFIFAKDQLDPAYLTSWTMIFLIALTWRVSLYILFKKGVKNEQINHSNIQRWEYHWVAMTAFTALVFSSLLYLPLEKEIFSTLLFLSVVFMAMSAGSAISSSSSKLVVITFLTLTSLPMLAKSLSDGVDYYLLAFVYLFFYLVLVKLSITGNKTVVENIQLKKQSELDSLKDALTGLASRRMLNLFSQKLISKSKRHQQHFSILLLDVDWFKKYNDTYGHLQRDAVLVDTANCIQSEAREEDIVVRFGGEEFLVVLPESDIETANTIAQRISNKVRSHTDVTVSIGIALFSAELTFENLIKKADDALYLAKQNGRDQIVVSDKP